MNVLLVCRVNKQIGYGHLKRCIAIGEYISTIGGKVSFALLDSEVKCKIDIKFSHFLHNIKIEKGSIKSRENTKSLRKDYKLVILDLIYNNFFKEYVFDNICTTFTPITEQLVAIDSVGDQSIIAHGSTTLVSKVIIPYAISKTYKYPAGKTIYGSKYAILSREYKNCIRKKYDEQAKNLLISTGGSDNKLYSETILSTIEGLRGKYNIRLIIGPLFDKVYAKQLRF